MTVETGKYSQDALANLQKSNFLSQEDFESLSSMQTELQDTYEKKQVWRTETEIRVSVLNDLKFPTHASKYWQAVREQSVFFENLITLSFDYRRNLIEIKRIEEKLEHTHLSDLDKAGFEIDLEEALFKKKNMEVASKDRMRELKIWSKVKNELTGFDKTFDTENVNSHQLLSYTQSYLLQVVAASGENITMSNSEARNLYGQTETMLKSCEAKGLLNEALKVISPSIQKKLLPMFGFKEILGSNK